MPKLKTKLDIRPKQFNLFPVRYQINARTELAVRYRDESPLEHHHRDVSFQILDRPETDLFQGENDEERDRIKRVRKNDESPFGGVGCKSVTV